MASLFELFSVLDGLGESSLGKPILTQPDPALRAASIAIRTGKNIDDALSAVEQQIDIARPVLRGLLFDVIDATDSSRGTFRRRSCVTCYATFMFQQPDCTC